MIESVLAVLTLVNLGLVLYYHALRSQIRYDIERNEALLQECERRTGIPGGSGE